MSHRPPYCPPRRCRSSGTGRRVLWVLAVGAAAAVAVSVSTDRSDHPAPTPRPEPMAGMRPSRLQAHATDNGVAGGAAAAQRELAARPAQDTETQKVSRTEPRREVGTFVVNTRSDPSAPPIRLTKVKSDAPHGSYDRALDDALLVARQKLVEQLRAQDPPVEQVPTLEQVRHHYLKPGSVREVKPTDEVRAAWAASNVDPDRVWVEVDVEVSREQLRDLRSDDRLGATGWLVAAAFLVVAALYGFLRVDAWTKGYLTGGLAVAAAAAAGGGVALLFLMR